MKLARFLKSDLVFSQSKWSSLAEVTWNLCDEVARASGLDAHDVRRYVELREKKAATTIGNGVAIPHARVDNLNEIVIAVATLNQPLRIKSPDARPVGVVFLVLAPTKQTQEYLQVLARIARFASKSAFTSRLLSANDDDALYRLLLDEDEQHVG